MIAIASRASRAVLVLALAACGSARPATDGARDSRTDRREAGAASPSHDARVEPGRAPSTVTRVYVGQRNGTLAVFALDARGELAPLGETRTGDFPSFAALAPSGDTMVVVNEASDELVSLSIAPSGATTLVSRIASDGSGPTHVSVHGTTAYVVNYGDGSVAALALDGDRLDRAIDVESAGRNAHEAVVDPSGRWLLVPCKGGDRIAVFAIAPDGTLTQHGEHASASGAGPRHLAFDARGRTAYVVDESASTIDVLAFDPASGSLSTQETLSTLPASYSGANTGSEILVSPDGRFVYASNRGHDSIAIFAIRPDATLEPRGHALLDARTPRSMAIDPSGAFLIAGAFDSDVLIRFRIESDGSLTRLGATSIAAPWYVGAFAIPDARR